MAIRITLTYSTYVARNLSSSAAGIRVGPGGDLRSCFESLVRPRFFSHKRDLDRSPRIRPSSMYNTIAREFIGEGSQSPLVMGLISILKSTSAPESTTLNVLGVSSFKASSIIPFLQGSKLMTWTKEERFVMTDDDDKELCKLEFSDDKGSRSQEGLILFLEAMAAMNELNGHLRLILTRRQWMRSTSKLRSSNRSKKHCQLQLGLLLISMRWLHNQVLISKEEVGPMTFVSGTKSIWE